MIKKLLFCFIAILLFSEARAEESFNISTALMRSTFKIQEDNKVGTVFILGQPVPDDASRAAYTLFTAAHVLNGMKNDNVTIFLRKKEKDTFIKFPIQLKIRSNGKPLWIEHPEVDIAVMRMSIPHAADLKIISTEMIANDDFLNKFEVNPGDDLLVLGFPYGTESNEAGFPILRSGRIANYPLTPTKTTKTFMLDFEIFGGNSGGPVFMRSRNRTYGGSTHIGTVRQLMGIVSQEKIIIETVKTIGQEVKKKHKLSIAVIVHASFLKELLLMLSPYENK